MSSVNGQIMPPVMGAAAFLMVEYVGIPYSEIVKHAILPAVLSYIGAVLHRPPRGAEARHAADASRAQPRPLARQAACASGSGISGTIVVMCARLLRCSRRVKPRSATRRRWAIGADRARRCTCCRPCSRPRKAPTCRRTSTSTTRCALETWPTVRAGLHFLIPIGVLIWCLMIEEMSPSLSAFWAIAVLIVLMLTQRAADRAASAASGTSATAATRGVARGRRRPRTTARAT